MHHVIECFAAEHVRVVPEVDDCTLGMMSNIWAQCAMNAVCFDAGRVEDMTQLKVLRDLIRLPYKDCWIEFRCANLLIGCLCSATSSADTGSFLILPLAKQKNGSWLAQRPLVVRDGMFKMEVNGVNDSSCESLRGFSKILAIFLTALNCVNVKRIEERPPAALNKARVRRGKQPLFSTWTLSISIPKERSESVALGGSHASPRVHLRRGHPREYRPGLWTWVQPCAVGAKENGMIHKDYKAEFA